MGRRTTFSRNNSFLPRLSFKSRGKRETWRFGWRSRVKWCSWFVSKRILFLPFSSYFPASRTGCVTALFQHGEVKRILSISFSLIERDDNSTCVNSIQNKKNKKKREQERRRSSRFHEWNRPKFTMGEKKTFSALLLAIVFSPRRNFTLVKRYFRIESKLRNKCCETSWLETLSNNGNWSWRARDFFADECKIWPVEQISNRMTKIYQFSHLTIFLAKYYYYDRNIITQSLNY